MRNDVLGKALMAYHKGVRQLPLITWTTYTEEDTMDIGHFFRAYETMPKIEQLALDLANGKILDVGCGAGSHSLYLQQKELDVTALDYSEGAIAVCKARGIHKTSHSNFFKKHQEKYDTLLLLMNGVGIVQNLEGLVQLFTTFEQCLHPKGQVLLDSSDLSYLFEGEQLPEDDYYGEVTFGIAFEGKEAQFPWLYIDFERLKVCAQHLGWKCEKIYNGEHYDYLARITREY